MVDEIGRRAAVGATIVALGIVGSGVFGGLAIADGAHNGEVGGGGGNGGEARARCVLPLGLSLGLIGNVGDQNACDTAGGDGGSGADY
jgi:hypothetical protein